MILRLVRPDRPEIAPERVVGDLAERPGQLDAGRPAADEHERHPGPPPVGVGLALGGLEGDEDPPADLGRVLDGLEARRDRGPFRMVEVGVMGPGRDDERVVRDRAAVGELDLAPVDVDADGLAEDDRRVALLAERASAAAGRCRRATGRRSRPGRAAAGRGGSCAGRRASGGPPGRCRGCARRSARRTRRRPRRRGGADAGSRPTGGHRPRF